jgi:hypothetical protein
MRFALLMLMFINHHQHHAIDAISVCEFVQPADFRFSRCHASLKLETMIGSLTILLTAAAIAVNAQNQCNHQTSNDS